MCLHVCPEVAFVSERLVTLVAGERFLPGVSPDVSLEEPGSGECLATEGTLTVVLCVSEEVVGQGGGRAALLPTVEAGSRVLRAHGEVQGLSLWGGGRGGGEPSGDRGACWGGGPGLHPRRHRARSGVEPGSVGEQGERPLTFLHLHSNLLLYP